MGHRVLGRNVGAKLRRREHNPPSPIFSDEAPSRRNELFFERKSEGSMDGNMAKQYMFTVRMTVMSAWSFLEEIGFLPSTSSGCH